MLTRCNQTETFLLIEKTNRHCLSLFVCHTEKGFNFLLCYYVYITIFTLCVYIYIFSSLHNFSFSTFFLIVCPVMKIIILYNKVFLNFVCVCVYLCRFFYSLYEIFINSFLSFLNYFTIRFLFLFPARFMFFYSFKLFLLLNFYYQLSITYDVRSLITKAHNKIKRIFNKKYYYPPKSLEIIIII